MAEAPVAVGRAAMEQLERRLPHAVVGRPVVSREVRGVHPDLGRRSVDLRGMDPWQQRCQLSQPVVRIGGAKQHPPRQPRHQQRRSRAVLSLGIESDEARRREPRRGEPGEDGCLPTHVDHRGLVIGSGVSAQHIAPRLAVCVEDRDVVNRRRDAAVEPA
jgi:hypothetical protein